MKWFKKFINWLIKANQNSFNGQRLDCCQLNKNNQHNGR
ncbi:MAG: hypothetical protein BWY15_01314 [Firmicutes bacterium ADurb.Bin193]|nr:MAG: hypothetical protein BWY15_01314 [Firmicutes bacterium ADurb.Bin193]